MPELLGVLSFSRGLEDGRLTPDPPRTLSLAGEKEEEGEASRDGGPRLDDCPKSGTQARSR